MSITTSALLCCADMTLHIIEYSFVKLLQFWTLHRSLDNILLSKLIELHQSLSGKATDISDQTAIRHVLYKFNYVLTHFSGEAV